MGFVSLDRTAGEFRTDLVYNKETNLGTATKNGNMLGSANHINDVALCIRNVISKAFEKTDGLLWSPTATFLEIMDDTLAPDLRGFLQVFLSGRISAPTSQQIERLATSIGQDISITARNEKWKLPKHILLFMTLRHLFRSSQLNTVIKRFGHAKSYTFTLALEAASAAALDQIVRYLTVPSISTLTLITVHQ